MKPQKDETIIPKTILIKENSKWLNHPENKITDIKTDI